VLLVDLRRVARAGRGVTPIACAVAAALLALTVWLLRPRRAVPVDPRGGLATLRDDVQVLASLVTLLARQVRKGAPVASLLAPHGAREWTAADEDLLRQLRITAALERPTSGGN